MGIQRLSLNSVQKNEIAIRNIDWTTIYGFGIYFLKSVNNSIKVTDNSIIL